MRRNGARRADLANQVDRADVDAQLKRCGGHDRAQIAALEAGLRFQAQTAREAAMMRQHGLFAEARLKLVRHALGKAPRVDEDQRGAVRADQIGHAIIDLRPHFVAGDGAEFVLGNFDGEFHIAAVAYVDDVGAFAEESGHFFDGPHGSGEADALRFGAAAGRDQCIQAREREGQVRAALVVRHGVDLVHDDGAGGAQHVARLLGGEQDEERFGRGDQHVRALFAHPLALPRGRVAGADGGANRRERNALGGRRGGDFGERHFQVDVDIVAQRLERRDVDDLGLVGERAETGGAHQPVEAEQKRGEGLAGTGRRGDEDVAARADLRPAEHLWFSGGGEALGEPVADEGVEVGEGGTCH